MARTAQWWWRIKGEDHRFLIIHYVIYICKRLWMKISTILPPSVESRTWAWPHSAWCHWDCKKGNAHECSHPHQWRNFYTVGILLKYSSSLCLFIMLFCIISKSYVLWARIFLHLSLKASTLYTSRCYNSVHTELETHNSVWTEVHTDIKCADIKCACF